MRKGMVLSTVILVMALILLLIPTSFLNAGSSNLVVNVSSPVNWVNTGIKINIGDKINITASGSWSPGPPENGMVGPDGSSIIWGDNFLNISDIGCGPFEAKTSTPNWAALIGYIGENPPPAGSYTSVSILTEAKKVFLVGSNFDSVATMSGVLWLNFNDDAYSGYIVDNKGQVTATIKINFADQTSDVSSFVTRLYQTCLDRSPDPAGFDNWVNNLISGKVTGGQAAYGFVFSEELKNRNLNNDQFLVIMYKAFFDRPADTGGYNNWMGLLNSGSSREFVFSNFVNSTEFANICAKYGIQAGTMTAVNTKTVVTGDKILLSGSAWNGVDVYYNDSTISNPGDSGYGTKWQCVELVRRFCAEKGLGTIPQLGTPGPAYTMWDKIATSTEFYRIDNGNNDTKNIPQFGDILVFNQGSGSWSSGHVAVVKEVTGGRVYFVQQNVGTNALDSLPINNNHIDNEGRYPIVLGWIRHK